MSGLCEVFLGVESANEEDYVLFDKGGTLADNSAAIELLTNIYDIYTEIGFINFSPYSTFAGLKMNAEFLRSQRRSCFMKNLTYLGAFKGSRIFAKLKKDGLLDADSEMDRYGYRYIDHRIGKLAHFLQKYTVTLRRRKSQLIRLFSIERYLDDKLAHFKWHFKIRENRTRHRMVKVHQEKLDAILHELNSQVADWFSDLLVLAEECWDEAGAEEYTGNKLSESLIVPLLVRFDDEVRSFAKVASTEDCEAAKLLL